MARWEPTSAALAAEAPARERTLPWKARLQPYGLVMPAMLVLAFFFAGPALYNISLSFQELSLFDIGKEGRWVGARQLRRAC